MKRILCLICSITILLLCCSCQENKIKFNFDEEKGSSQTKDMIGFIPKERVSLHDPAELVEEFDSQISCGFKNSDGTYTVYLFSTPFRFKRGEGNLYTIDNTLTDQIEDDKKEDYSLKNTFSDIACYFPKSMDQDNGILIEDYYYALTLGGKEKMDFVGAEKIKNIWGKEEDAAVYKGKGCQLASYATTSGIKCELTIDKKPESGKVDLWLRSPLNRNFIKNKQYLLFQDTKGDVEGVIRKPIGKSLDRDGGEKIYTNCGIKLSSGNVDEKNISLVLDEELLSEKWENPVTLEFSVDLYRGDMADSTVYSNRLNNNQYLDNICILGNSPGNGIGRHYTRLDIHKYINDKPDNIISAFYGIYNLYSESKSNALSVNKMQELWSSAQITWNSKSDKFSAMKNYQIEKPGYCLIDITDIAKKSMNDDTYSTEINGLLLKAAEETKGYQIFATNDNSVYPSFIEVTFKEKPENFYVK